MTEQTLEAGRTARERRLQAVRQFAEPFRPNILPLIEQSSRVEDLARSFPALLFALASGYGSAEERKAALDIVVAGAPLRRAAAALGLPYWLRRIAPQALKERLPRLPDRPEFSLSIANFVPGKGSRGRRWLKRVGLAAQACDEDFALWVARQRETAADGEGLFLDLALAAWAWHAKSPSAPAHALLEVHWTNAISQRRAIAEALAWLRRIELAAILEGGLGETWYPAGSAVGYDFVPLATLEEFLAEAETLDNCLDQYGDQLSEGGTRLYSVRRAGMHVAAIEIAPHEDDGSAPAIRQLRGPRNKRVSSEVWQAALIWLGQQRLRPLPTGVRPAQQAARQRALRAIWRPYLESLGTAEARSQVEDVLVRRSRQVLDSGPRGAPTSDARPGGR